jgi:hypothetical protein
MSLIRGILESKKRSIVISDTITITNNYVVFNAAGGVITGNNTTTVTSSSAWTSTITYNEGSGWLTRTPTSGSSGQGVSISVTTNSSGLTRTADITFTCGTATVNFDVTQTPS